MRDLINMAIIAAAIILSACASSGGISNADSLSVLEKVSINAPADKVWARISNFSDLALGIQPLQKPKY